MLNYIVIGTSMNGGDIYFNNKSYQYIFGAWCELYRIAAHEMDDGYAVDVSAWKGQLLVTDKEDNLVKIYKIYEVKEDGV